MVKKSGVSRQKSTQKSLKDQIVDAALDLSSRMGWDMVTLTDIADKTHIGLADLHDVFEDKSDILAAYGRRIDRRVLESCSGFDPSTPERDRLFEILMERFDVLNENRAAVVSILKSFLPDPKQAVISLPHLGRSMAWMLEAAGIETAGVKGAVRVLGLTAIYMAALRVWMKDETSDLSQTMATIDRALGQAERLANSFML